MIETVEGVPAAAAASSRLDQRYGRTPRSRTLNRAMAWVVGGAILVAAALWVGWRFLGEGDAIDLEYRTVGFEPISDSEFALTAMATFPRDRSAVCEVQALGRTKAIVGWKLVDLAADAERNRTFRVVFQTTEAAVTGLISHCWLE